LAAIDQINRHIPKKKQRSICLHSFELFD